MKLTKINIDNILEPLFDFEGTEKDIEQHIFENIKEIAKGAGWGDIRRIERQYVIPFKKKGRIICDIMVWHTDGTGTVIEVKKTKTNRNDLLCAIGQVLSYNFKIKKMLGKPVRMVIASPQINSDVYSVIHENNLNIKLLMVDGNRIIYMS